MKRITLLIVALCLLLPCFPAMAAEETVSVLLSCDDSAYLGGEIGIKVIVQKPSVPLAGLEFSLSYDPEYVQPKITENQGDSGGMDAFFVNRPTGWEQMSYHSESENKYYLRFAMPEDESAYLDSASQLVLELPFAVVQAGSARFSVDSADIIAVKADSSLSLSGGKGSELEIVSAGESEKISVTLSGDEAVPANGVYSLYADVKNLGDASGILAVEFRLQFDSAVFAPKLTENTENQMDSFMLNMPANGWEQMCSFESSGNAYILRFAALNMGGTEAEILKSGESLKLCIPFEVKGTEGDIGAFSVPTGSVLGINGVTAVIGGSGSSKSVAVDKPAENVFPSVEGFELQEGYLLGAIEKTDIADFLSKFSGFYLLSNNEKVESGYVKTGYVLTNGAVSATVVVRGDANGTGVVDAGDYALIKRTCLKTFTPTELQIKAMTITNGATVVAADYGQVKRHVLKTHNINK